MTDKDLTIKMEKECPKRCGLCAYFIKINSNISFCVANGKRTLTYDFSNPKDRPLPMPLNCYWWYTNRAFKKGLGAKKKKCYQEERNKLLKG